MGDHHLSNPRANLQIRKVASIAPEPLAFSKVFAKEKGFPLQPCNMRQVLPLWVISNLTI